MISETKNKNQSFLNSVKPKTKVFIADDHPIFRDGLIKVIEREPSFQFIGQAGDGEEALQLIRKLRPEIAILDIEMPEMSGIDVVRALHHDDLQIEIIILTMYNDEEFFHAAMDMGVKGYVLKDNAASDLIACLRTVANGSHYVTPSLSEHFVTRINIMNSFLEQNPSLRDLTPAQKRILGLVAQNKTSKEIAKDLYISVRTVENHRAQICEKLGLKGHNKLFEFALEHKASLVSSG